MTRNEVIEYALSLEDIIPAYHMNKEHWNTIKILSNMEKYKEEYK
jgi:predicted DNA-binding protein (MmcQ/YjbR family)